MQLLKVFFFLISVVKPCHHLLTVLVCVCVCVIAVCGCDMAQTGFFVKSGDYLCPLDFQRLHGTLCNSCREFVEGDVVTVLGKTYHPACFVCTICKCVERAQG